MMLKGETSLIRKKGHAEELASLDTPQVSNSLLCQLFVADFKVTGLTCNWSSWVWKESLGGPVVFIFANSLQSPQAL